MFSRVVLVTSLSCLGILWLLGVATSAAESPSYELYTVQGTQTIASIATEYKINPEVIAYYNRLKMSDPLRPGQTLLIPLNVQLPKTIVTAQPQPVEAPASPTARNLPAPKANQVVGYRGVVIANNAEIRSKPNGGDILWDKLQAQKELLVIGQTETHYAVLMKNGNSGWIPRLAIELSDERVMVDRPVATTPVVSAGNQELISFAYEFLGIPYKYGGHLPANVDCSLFVQTVFKKFGMTLPRTARAQFAVGKQIAIEELQPGDRLYFYNPKRTMIGHTGIYVGNGRFIHASSNRGCVFVDDLSNPTYAKKYAGARR